MTEKEQFRQPSTTTSAATTQPIAQNLGEAVSDVADQAKQQVSQLTDQAKQQVSSQIDAQKQKASEALASVATALRQTGTQLRSSEQAGIADYANKAADQVERVSGFLRDKDVSDILHETELMARRQPALFLGGAFVLGIIGARFLKSTRPPQPYPRQPNGYRPSAGQPPRPMGGNYGPNYNPTNRQPMGGQPSYGRPAGGPQGQRSQYGSQQGQGGNQQYGNQQGQGGNQPRSNQPPQYGSQQSPFNDPTRTRDDD